ncbi:MAG: branched-chain amino acid ABC transporter permease [Caldilineaceae bacterium]|nr:branched-chain amino acid ABC transporter permease [Caldilineaceae bacterium]
MDTLNDVLQFSINALSLGSLYALMALGLAIVYGILRLVNFAYGELVMVGGYTLLVLGAGWMPWVIVALLAVAMAVITSLLLERVAFRPVRNASANTMLVTSFGVSILLQNAALLLVSPRAQAVALPSIFTQNITVGGLTISTMNILTLVVCFTLLGLLTLFLTRSLLGIALRAAADDFTMTRLLGIPANRVIATAFAISGGLAGVVAIIWTGRVGSVTPSMGLTPVLIAFVATVIGGMESLVGAVVGGFLLGILTVGLQSVLPQNLLDFRQAVVFAIVILVLLFRPQGLIQGKYARERV